ncbi:hypothetical protein [Amycolatopsis sp. NPDC001319]|uniref:hypothetical protein n=1 Tax=unclassified Amycolatopsis TaxID=2618356 RepID=UPI0036C76E6A
MATVPIQQAKLGGVVLTTTAATAGPDKVKPGDRVLLVINNAGASAITATVVVPGNTAYGQPEPDVTSVSIGAAKIGVLGPFPAALAGTDGLVAFTVSSTTSVTYSAVRV